MAVRRGISILDVLPITTGPAIQAPDPIVEAIGVLTILDHSSTSSPAYHLHEGVLQSILDTLNINTQNWPLRVPGLTHGLPFRLAVARTAAAGANQEAPPAAWVLDIEVRNVEVMIPGLRAATKAGGSGATPLTLQPVGGPPARQRVRFLAQTYLRFNGLGGNIVNWTFADAPDPLDPLAPTGRTARVTAQPPSFLFGNSRFGMTVEDVVIDASPLYTPADIEARGHDEIWQGVAYKEASFYFPPNTPLLSNLSITTRDVIAGRPGGLQGEMAIEFGEDLASTTNAHLTMEKLNADGTVAPLAASAPTPGINNVEYTYSLPDGQTRMMVRAVFDIGPLVVVPGHTDLSVDGVWWQLPDGTQGNSAITPWFELPADTDLRYRLRIGDPLTAPMPAATPATVPGNRRELITVFVGFHRNNAPAGGGTPPVVNATRDGFLYPNTLHLRGPAASLAGVQLAIVGGGVADWDLKLGNNRIQARQTHTWTIPALPAGVQRADLEVSNEHGIRRIKLDITPSGVLVFGHQDSQVNTSPGAVTVHQGGRVTPTEVLDTFLAAPFHARDQHKASPELATTSGNLVTVPQGADAEVEVLIPALGNTPPVVPPEQPEPVHRAVTVLFNWDEPNPSNGEASDVRLTNEQTPIVSPGHDPRGMPLVASMLIPMGSTPRQKLTEWVKALGPVQGTRRYFLVGRTDDLKYGATLAGNNSYNDALAQRRLDKARQLLLDAGATDAQIVSSRIERVASAINPGNPDAPVRIAAAERMALTTAMLSSNDPNAAPVYNRYWTADGMDMAQHNRARDDSNRPPYRSVDIYAEDSGAAPVPPPPPPPDEDAVPISMLVPGPDGDPPPPKNNTDASATPLDYRVRLRAKWDSPTLTGAGDGIPTEAEALVAWKRDVIEFPARPTGTPPTVPVPQTQNQTGTDYWEVLLRWAYDVRTGQTQLNGAVSMPDGSIILQSNAIAGAMALAPAMSAIVDPADSIARLVSLPALLAAGGALGALLNTSQPESILDIDKIAINYTWDGDSKIQGAIDYTVELRVNRSVPGLGTLQGRLRLKYKNVGLRFDFDGGNSLNSVALTYDDLSVDVVDPGTWSLGGALGNLIRVAASRMGNGSQWLEFDLAFALDLGIIKLEGATVRALLDPNKFGIEFRGLTASVEIPETLKGRGSVTIGDNGAFRALLALEVIPAKLSAYGALAVDQDFVSLEVGVQLPVGIPLANTGFGIFGFMGRFVANGTRNLDGLANPDPVQRQLDWYLREPDQKYKRKSGQYAFGVGAVIGTLPDGGFTFNADGSLTVGFPDISVVFGIDAKLISPRKSQATAKGTPNNASLRILGMVLIDPQAVTIAVKANYEIPKVVKITVPLSAYFPLAGGDAWFIRIGTDKHPSRPGDPVSVTLLPETLDVRAWAFVLIEERGIQGLGGTLIPAKSGLPALNFDGFAIGFGAGFDLSWTAGPFTLEIGAFLVVGMGTKPLLFAGGAGVWGELDLVVVSVGVSGTIHFHISDTAKYIEGHFCGHVDLWLFDVSGCVDIRIGNKPATPIPAPPSPLLGVDLCDHLAVIKGKAVTPGAGALPVVWPDTVPVLRFSHFMIEDFAPSAFKPTDTSPAAKSLWSGTTELKYSYRLTAVELYQRTGADANNPAHWTQLPGDFDAAWWLPTHRQSVIEGGDKPGPSTEEGRELGLLSWDPRAWSRWLGEGSQNLPGDPAQTIDEVCNPAKPAEPSCAWGEARLPLPGALGRFIAQALPGAAFPSHFVVRAELPDALTPELLATMAEEDGWVWHPGAVEPLHGSVLHHGRQAAQGWRLPYFSAQGQLKATAPVVLTLNKPVLEAELLLEVCPARTSTAPKTQEGCDTPPADNTVYFNFVGNTTGSRYFGEKIQGVDVAVGDLKVDAAQLLGYYLQGEFPGTVDTVSVDVDLLGKGGVLSAFDGQGAMVGQDQQQGGRLTLRVTAPGIRKFTLKTDANALVFKVCWGDAKPPLLIDLLDLRDDEQGAPIVIGTREDGSTEVLPWELVPAADAVAVTHVVKTCPKVRYKLGSLGSGKPAWTSLQLQGYTRGRISLVALCGVTQEAGQAQQADQEHRDSLKLLIEGLILAAAENTPTRPVYLDANQDYEIRVRWAWKGFVPQQKDEEPPAPGNSGWTAAPEERYRFHTASYGLATAANSPKNTSLDADPAQGGPGFDERTFDPRGLHRYVTAAQPTHEHPPHFLEDHVGFWFMADHLNELVGKYDRLLQVKVLHTRPEPGSMHGTPAHVAGELHPLDVTIGVAWQITTDAWFDADQRFIDAGADAACLDGVPAVGSSQVSVSAKLEPRSEYDLLLVSVPKVVDPAKTEDVIERTHFRTSRYANPAGLLKGLGFDTPIGLDMPYDAIISATLPGSGVTDTDAALDAALTTLGLDPWPLPGFPRTTVLWQQPAGAGQPWRLAGVLLEADEPIYRAGFKTGAKNEGAVPARLDIQSLQLRRKDGDTATVLGSLTLRVRNSSGARVLLMADTPLTLAAGHLHDLRMQMKERGVAGAVGQIPLLDRPLTVAQEL